MLKAENVTKAFGGNTVLNGVSLTVRDHEIVCLMGPSGAGKTTFLRCLCGLEIPDGGTIEVGEAWCCRDGRMNRKLQPYRQKIGLVFQSWNLFPHWTVLDNLIQAPLYQKLLTRQEAEKKAGLLLERLQLQDKAQAWPQSLSGGQKQRAAIARACMLSPEILCFDEPTSALDDAAAAEVSGIIQALAEEPMGILIVTHDEQFARRTGTRLVTLDQLRQG